MTDYARAIAIARDLMSEHGENPQYDRGVAEVIGDLFGRVREDVLDDVRGAVASSNATVDKVLHISRRILDGDQAEQDRLARYERWTKLLIDASESWVDKINELQDVVQRRPDLFPIRVPSTQMPSPDGWVEGLYEQEVPAWRMGDDAYDIKLVFSPAGWAVFADEPGVDRSALLVEEVTSFAYLGDAVDRTVDRLHT